MIGAVPESKGIGEREKERERDSFKRNEFEQKNCPNMSQLPGFIEVVPKEDIIQT